MPLDYKNKPKAEHHLHDSGDDSMTYAVNKDAGIYGKFSCLVGCAGALRGYSTTVYNAVQLLRHWKNAETAKMMFDEAQVFKGLLAWFSASVPRRLRSQWGKKGPNLTIFILKARSRRRTSHEPNRIRI